MKRSNLKTRLKVYSYCVIALLALLCVRLAFVQIFLNQQFQTQAKDNRVRLVPVKAPRGEIYAADGEVLAANELVYTLNLSYLGVSGQDSAINRLEKLLQPYYPEINEKFIKEKIELQQYRLFEPVVLMRDIPWELVVKLEENRQELPGVTVNVEPLRSYPQGSMAGHVLGFIHSIDPKELEGSDYSINSLIGKSGLEKQYEKELRGQDGARQVEVNVGGRPVRELVTLEPHPGNNLYLTIDSKLQKALELSMEQNLQRLQQQNPKAKVASAVVLNVKTGEVLAMASSPALNPDDWKGNFKPELTDYYIPQGSYDPMKPGALSNRAIQSTYPPGSTFKPITGMAALEMGVMDPLHDLVNCSGSYWVAPFIKCTGVHGNVSYYNALAVSCNTYFQEMGRRAGKDEIIHVASEFGLGSRTGIDLPYEEKGLLPTAAWKKEIGTALLKRKYERLFKELDRKYANLMLDAADAEERQKLERKKDAEKAQLEAERKIDYNFNTNWQPYNTFNMSIGQGDNDYTVIQLANYAATIANGGFLMKPHVVKKIVSHEGKVLKIIKPEVVHEVDISPLSIAETKRAMLAVTQPGGTAYSLFSHFPADIQVGAKTGTAETGRSGDNPRKEYHGVFIAFAPVDNPQIAMAAVVEYGNAGYASAGYLVRDVFEQYFGVKDHLTSPEAEKKLPQ